MNVDHNDSDNFPNGSVHDKASLAAENGDEDLVSMASSEEEDDESEIARARRYVEERSEDYMEEEGSYLSESDMMVDPHAVMSAFRDMVEDNFRDSEFSPSDVMAHMLFGAMQELRQRDSDDEEDREDRRGSDAFRELSRILNSNNSKSKWEEVREFLEHIDGTAKADGLLRHEGFAGYRGASALHFLLGHDAPLTIIQVFLHIENDEGEDIGFVCSSETDAETGETPLHMATRKLSSLDILDYLLRFGDETVMFEEDNYGNTAMDNICVRIYDIHGVKQKFKRNSVVGLKKVYQSELKKANRLGNGIQSIESYYLLEMALKLLQHLKCGCAIDYDIELHRAIKTGCREEIILAIIFLQSSQILAKGHEGQIAIHLLLESRKLIRGRMNVEIILSSMIKLCPSCVRIPDKKGHVALHYALINGWNEKVVMMILNETPRQALLSRDTVSHMLPFMLSHKKPNVSFLLLKKEPLAMRGLAEDPPWKRTADALEQNKLLTEENRQLKSEIQKLKELLKEKDELLALQS